MSKNTKSKVPRHTRRIQSSNLALVNFNIDRKKPFRDVLENIQVPTGNDNETEVKEVLVRVYADQALLDKKYGKKVETNPLPDTIAI